MTAAYSFTLDTNGRAPVHGITVPHDCTLYQLTDRITGELSSCNGVGHDGHYTICWNGRTWTIEELCDSTKLLRDMGHLDINIVRVPRTITIEIRSTTQSAATHRVCVSTKLTVGRLLEKLAAHSIIQGDPSCYAARVSPWARHGLDGPMRELPNTTSLVEVDCSIGAIEYHIWEAVPLRVTICVRATAQSRHTACITCPITEASCELRRVIEYHIRSGRAIWTLPDNNERAARNVAPLSLQEGLLNARIILTTADDRSKTWSPVVAGPGHSTLADAIRALGTTALACVWDVIR